MDFGINDILNGTIGGVAKEELLRIISSVLEDERDNVVATVELK